MIAIATKKWIISVATIHFIDFIILITAAAVKAIITIIFFLLLFSIFLFPFVLTLLIFF